MAVDVAQALSLRIEKDLSYGQIAAIQGVTRQAIHKRIKHLEPTEETQTYKSHRADILAHSQLRLLQELTPAKLKKMPGRDLIVGAGILYDKERLERGQSTANIAYDAQSIGERYAQLKELADSIQDAELVDNPVDNPGSQPNSPSSVMLCQPPIPVSTENHGD